MVKKMNDNQWHSFVALCEKDFNKCEFKEGLIEACSGYEDIAKVVYFHNRMSSFKWLESRIQAMDNLIPNAELRKGNLEKIRKVLLSFPC